MLPLLVIFLTVVACLSPWLKNRWQYRHIPAHLWTNTRLPAIQAAKREEPIVDTHVIASDPGPFALPLIGNLLPIMRMGLHEYMMQCRLRYGKTFKLYLGKAMLLVTADPDVARKLNYRMINRVIQGQLQLNEDDKINSQGLVVARDETWRTLRLAWQPTFQSGSLEGYAELMDSSALQLAQHLKQAAVSGEPVDMWRELGRMTLHVVGSTAYGVDFHTLEQDASSGAAAEGTQLINACQTVFAAGSITRGSIYILLNAIIPLPWLVGWAARNMPDKRITQLIQARHTIRSVSMDLIKKWRAANPASEPAAANGTANGVAASVETPLIDEISAAVPTAPAAAAAVDVAPAGSKDAAADGAPDAAAPKGKAETGRRKGPMAPGSFMGLMLTARDKNNGSALSDTAVIAQANTFTLAGYETTANTLAYCVYNIALHPEVEQRLLAEVDAYGRGRKVQYRDLDQFPYAEAVVREALRLFPPATILSREVKEGGFPLTPEVTVPAGQQVMSFLYGYQRDPAYWPAALEFKPERWLPEGAHLASKNPDAWTPFGSGARMCVGWRFALQEAKIALVRLYQDQTYRLQPGQVPLALQQSITLSPRNGVWVTVVPRS